MILTDPLDNDTTRRLRSFMQAMIYRIIQGHYRYGEPNKRKKYLTRLKMELEAYEKEGNAEHLINVANYCFLELEAPENRKIHFDNTVKSVTRGIV